MVVGLSDRVARLEAATGLGAGGDADVVQSADAKSGVEVSSGSAHQVVSSVVTHGEGIDDSESARRAAAGGEKTGEVSDDSPLVDARDVGDAGRAAARASADGTHSEVSFCSERGDERHPMRCCSLDG
mgnify:CR=1 FL=1